MDIRKSFFALWFLANSILGLLVWYSLLACTYYNKVVSNAFGGVSLPYQEASNPLFKKSIEIY